MLILKSICICYDFIFQFVAFLLIGVAAAAKKAAILQSLPVVGGKNLAISFVNFHMNLNKKSINFRYSGLWSFPLVYCNRWSLWSNQTAPSCLILLHGCPVLNFCHPIFSSLCQFGRFNRGWIRNNGRGKNQFLELQGISLQIVKSNSAKTANVCFWLQLENKKQKASKNPIKRREKYFEWFDAFKFFFHLNKFAHFQIGP